MLTSYNIRHETDIRDSQKEHFMERQLILYCGEDERVFQYLKRRLKPHQYELKWTDNTQLCEEESCDWYRLLILDVDLATTADLERLRSIKACNRGSRVIVVTDNKTLTSVALARLNGAEAIFFKPLSDFNSVLEVIEGAFAGLDRWRHVLLERETI